MVRSRSMYGDVVSGPSLHDAGYSVQKLTASRPPLVVIATIYTVLRTSLALKDSDRLRKCVLCLQILWSCSSPSTSGSHPADMPPKEGTTLFNDVIALAEDEIITTLQSPEFRGLDNRSKCSDVDHFFTYYQQVNLVKLATRVSEKTLRVLDGAVKDLLYEEPRYGETWNHGLLEWLKSLEKERDIQIVRFLCLQTGCSSPWG